MAVDFEAPITVTAAFVGSVLANLLNPILLDFMRKRAERADRIRENDIVALHDLASMLKESIRHARIGLVEPGEALVASSTVRNSGLGFRRLQSDDHLRDCLHHLETLSNATLEEAAAQQALRNLVESWDALRRSVYE